MAEPEQVILSCFSDSETEVSTTAIVHALEPTLLLPDGAQPDAVHEYHQKKAQLHRKTLYYLNKLVEQGVLKVTREGKNREKYFVRPQSTQPELAPRAVPLSIPIEGYEQLGIIHRFEALTWVERLNSVLVETTACKTPKEVMHAILSAFAIVNDVVALNDAEMLLEHVDAVGITTFVERLNSKCNDYGKRVCLIIDFTNLTKGDLLLKLVEHTLNEKLRNITFIYDCTPRESQHHAALFQRLISLYSTAGKDLYIKNQAVHEAPYFIGRIGPYTFDEQDWKTYKKQMQGSIQEIICSQVSVLVDVKRLFSHLPRTEEAFRSFLMKIAHTLLMTNSLQRRKCEELFGSLIKLNAEHARNFFLYSRNNIRFWNYGWKNPAIDQVTMVQMFKNILRTLHEFCISEETIYKSCGMPTRFRTAFSCCFDDAVKDIFTPPDYTQFTIKKFEDFYQPTIQTWIKTKEELFQVFDGGDIISFYKHGGDPEHLFREISFILTTYRIPFFRFRFTGPQERETTLKAWT